MLFRGPAETELSAFCFSPASINSRFEADRFPFIPAFRAPTASFLGTVSYFRRSGSLRCEGPS